MTIMTRSRRKDFEDRPRGLLCGDMNCDFSCLQDISSDQIGEYSNLTTVAWLMNHGVIDQQKSCDDCFEAGSTQHKKMSLQGCLLCVDCFILVFMG